MNTWTGRRSLHAANTRAEGQKVLLPQAVTQPDTTGEVFHRKTVDSTFVTSLSSPVKQEALPALSLESFGGCRHRVLHGNAELLRVCVLILLILQLPLQRFGFMD